MSKKARSEGNRVAVAIKANKTEYYVADVDLEDDAEDVIAAVTSVRKTLGKVKANFIVISAGIKNLIVVVDIADPTNLTAEKWLTESLNGITTEITVESPTSAKSVVELDTPFKLKDIVRSNAFSYLRKLSLLEEESEEEEYLEF